MVQTERRSDSPGRSFVEMIGDLARGSGPDGLTLGEVRDDLDERAFGLLILILAIPCLVPALYGVPQIIGVPILILAVQLLAGRQEPWLPKAILNRRIKKPWLDRMAEFASKRLDWVERLSRPRLTSFTGDFGRRFAAFWMIVATLTIILPLTNTLPSLALALLAAGLLQRDGLFVLAGAALAAAWLSVLIAIPVAALVFGAPWAVDLWDKSFGALQRLMGA